MEWSAAELGPGRPPLPVELSRYCLDSNHRRNTGYVNSLLLKHEVVQQGYPNQGFSVVVR